MTTSTLLAAVVVTALLSAALAPALLRWLPESAAAARVTGSPGEEVEPDYRTLVQPNFVLACALCSGVAAAVSWTVLPLAVQPLWTVLSLTGVLLAAIDAVTTWLPLSLTRATWAAMTVATLVAASLAQSWPLLVRAGIGAAALFAVYYLIYGLSRWVSRGTVAFGDVRFAPLLGAAAGADGWPLLYFCLLAGSVLGGVQGAVNLARGRPGGFPYTPAMLAGCYLAAVVLALVP